MFWTDGFEAAQEAERQEIALIRKEKDEADLRNFKAFEKMMLEGKAIREAREREKRGEEEVSNENQENLSFRRGCHNFINMNKESLKMFRRNSEILTHSMGALSESVLQMKQVHQDLFVGSDEEGSEDNQDNWLADEGEVQCTAIQNLMTTKKMLQMGVLVR